MISYSGKFKAAHFLIRIQKSCVYFGRFWKIGILSDKEILYFEGQDKQSSYPVDTNIS